MANNPVNTCSKSTIDKLEKWRNTFKVNNEDTRMTQLTSLSISLKTAVFIVNFEHI